MTCLRPETAPNGALWLLAGRPTTAVERGTLVATGAALARVAYVARSAVHEGVGVGPTVDRAFRVALRRPPARHRFTTALECSGVYDVSRV